MRRIKLISKLFVMGFAIAVLIGCSKRSSEEQAAQPPPTNVATTLSHSKTQAVAVVKGQTTSSAAQSLDGIPTPEATNAEQEPPPATQIASLETEYKTNTELTARAEIIYKISDVGTAAAIPALGRIFSSETDPELKTEVLTLLADVDNQDDQKLAILSAAVGADQPKDVRETAIDALTDLDASQRALPILQALLSDPDSEIHDDAQDAIDVIRAATSTPQK